MREEFFESEEASRMITKQPELVLHFGLSTSTVSFENSKVMKALEKELTDFLKSGSTTSEELLTHANPTLFRSDRSKYEVHYTANPFASYELSDENDTSRQDPCAYQCKKTLAKWIAHFKCCSVSVKLAWADAFQKCLDYSYEDKTFNFIDCSNVGDHDSMLGIMVSASLVLKPSGILFTGTMLWASLAMSLEKYLEMILGISYYMMPTVLGLKLGVDVDLGSSTQISFEGRDIRLIWRKIRHSQSPTSLSEGDVLSALSVVFQKCFCLAGFNDGLRSIGKPPTSSTVATSVLILKHIVKNANLALGDTIEVLQR